ncbi:MAG TPA: hypothetical protein VFG99_08385 [Chloroflexia bacterium]|nr:hypothetical protein [Chloroflexia bacterium]
MIAVQVVLRGSAVAVYVNPYAHDVGAFWVDPGSLVVQVHVKGYLCVGCRRSALPGDPCPMADAMYDRFRYQVRPCISKTHMLESDVHGSTLKRGDL